MIMKTCVVLSCLLAVVMAANTYRHVNIDINELIENKKLLMAYTNCFLDKGKCTPAGKKIKENIRIALKTGCDMCPDEYLESGLTLINHVIKNEAGVWKELTDKYDPYGIWKKKYEDRAKIMGILSY